MAVRGGGGGQRGQQVVAGGRVGALICKQRRYGWAWRRLCKLGNNSRWEEKDKKKKWQPWHHTNIRVATAGDVRSILSRYAQNPTQKEVARGGYGRIFCGREEVSGGREEVSGGSGSGGAGQNFLCVPVGWEHSTFSF